MSETTSEEFGGSSSWLARHMKNCFDGIVYCLDKDEVNEKKKACERLKIDVMLEDNPFIINGLTKNNLRVIFVKQPYNQNAKGTGVSNIWEAFDKI